MQAEGCQGHFSQRFLPHPPHPRENFESSPRQVLLTDLEFHHCFFHSGRGVNEQHSTRRPMRGRLVPMPGRALSGSGKKIRGDTVSGQHFLSKLCPWT